MIIDTLENLEQYASVNPRFAKAIEYLKSTDLNAQEPGKVELDGKDLVVNFSIAKGKTKEQAQLETHKNFIDIQIPLSCTEVMGYTPACNLPEGEYNAEKDITKFAMPSEAYIPVHPGMFAIFFPQDGHAPCISEEESIRKVIVKVRV
ncbi:MULTISPECIES: YhcH/YjgK/YiaL family protein [Bacteroidaceae]|jgi:biofilm protein TabA|uniref:YhcH/YjgK/YiaL family protein n=1 Tax=Bacteroidaceae TaxID=815 RepID=UPI000D0BC9DF|nr:MULTISPECIES: YhcH/YjgK/YiaL family protein [Bacteroidaceae]MCL1607739.1 YhcH/YjgK/YiaL family protein [Mediterranea sp. ET5]MDM8123233.1 YhcH/YjgK/YiaL family protein [Mediterranea massiliensis]MDM8197286.1 YhcH/YjgK/YiaL family protein [Mediterranea massiliensis]